MNKLSIKSDPRVDQVFNSYPKPIKKELLMLRQLILETAEENDEINALEETLKWGEPSYLSKFGSTVRIDWKEKNPDKLAMYFKCTSKLVPTFKAVYGNKFEYEGNRAILFDLGSKLSKTELKHCILMALRYHKLKHLPLLGASKVQV
ncbi:MAG: DUF1801 domain-containing protein [Eudoraea sp.]|nr:DUF1801 domain-containing protein [Eudoraea sp.]